MHTAPAYRSSRSLCSLCVALAVFLLIQYPERISAFSIKLHTFPRLRQTRGASISTRCRMSADAEALVLPKLGSNGLGFLRLNRPKALNAANKEMTGLMLDQLHAWESTEEAKAFCITSTSNRALCSGGDVKALAAALQSDPSSTLPQEALANEYKLVHAIASSQLPSVAIMDGVTMGFGVGISGFATFRVVTERTLFAMPENAIALIPDVGFAHLLRKHPSLAKFLALTGTKLGGKFSPPRDLLYAGLGTHYVDSSKIEALHADLEAATLGSYAEKALGEVIAAYASEPQLPSRLEKMSGAMDACFGAEVRTVAAARAAMSEHAAAAEDAECKAVWQAAIAGLEEGCPFTMCTALHHQLAVHELRPPPGLAADSLEGVLMAEYRAMLRLAKRADFAEGVRARLVDKDNRPVWAPSSIAEVKPEEVEACFAPLEGEGELQLRKRGRGEGDKAT